ncbi:hypothetical protein QCD83_11530 [Pseudomonas savastanoi pv. phaseolicola]|uniref:Uncharacterized protein n=1 Tax=Pseudomonas savastanoi pv. glycinea TaxID=318 RepID=A0A3M3FTS2_PSESG|nr:MULTISPECIES: hypothetical protein [Pseudomonas]KPB82300.1 Uncharacterized protein AC504_0924 [Pseudomonas syringae pv. maculicola]KPB46151.1 Uncharacterized protein AC513_4559 [Pseudomonas savastanoi pv. phaseolicola]KPB50206.1 Uncharacterized protein AC512_1213 [Pseudomonas savastanoi pv. phaseolicola]MBN4177289.1 hypothetical protein [Pseudomonas savastanoi pv. phaseolicola]MBN4183512.1 hypothetical protein [Pseudomonas savastanoi pv. phaseolicola]
MATPSAPTLPNPVVQGASAKKEISLSKGIVLELPAFKDPRCTFVILNLANADNSNRPLLSGSSSITSGEPTIITLENTGTDPSMIFKPTHKARITGTVQVTDMDTWPDTPESAVYSFIE